MLDLRSSKLQMVFIMCLALLKPWYKAWMKCGMYFRQVAVPELLAPLTVTSTAADLIGKKTTCPSMLIPEL